MTLKFSLIRVLIDCLCAVLIFLGFVAGIHYGTAITGLYFWFMKVLLGLIGITAVLVVIRWLRGTVLFILKNCSIYAQCRDDCHTVIGAFHGIASHFTATISIPVFNKLIRDSLGEIKQVVLEKGEGSSTAGVLETIMNSKVAKVSVNVVEKAFDYVDECILGYCYANVSAEKGIVRCSLEAFTLFVVNSVPIFGKVITVVTIETILRVGYWVAFIAWSIRTFQFSVMNLIMLYVLGKVLSFILTDAIFEPMLMYEIIASFKKRAWDSEYESKISELISAIPALGKLASYGNGDSSSEESVDGSNSEESTGSEESTERGDA